MKKKKKEKERPHKKSGKPSAHALKREPTSFLKK
jgi:hypothetical protein